MRSSPFKYALLILPLIGLSFAYWGFQGHKLVNEYAIYACNDELFAFYKANKEYIIENAVAADIRKHSDPEEAPRHYIDIDVYSVDGSNPFGEMPRGWELAKNKFTEDTLKAFGTLPWNTLWVYYDLVEAFKVKDKDEILRLSADLGHYIADACVPLHTTLNYDGQLTGQKGVHSFWESRLVELYSDNYDLSGIKAEYIEYPKDYIWDVIIESHSHVKVLLEAERNASNSVSDAMKYTYIERNGKDELQPSEAFSMAFDQNMGNMVEMRMRSSVEALSSLWLSAWVDAGQPDLSTLE